MFASNYVGVAYKAILKPFFFRMDPEKVHDRMIRFGSAIGSLGIARFLTRFAFHYEHPMLEQTIHGIRFPNPIGLAAGFDKNAKIMNAIEDTGFGFEEVGSVTAHPCTGNAGTRLWRLPKSEGLVVNYGLLNDGVEVVTNRVRKNTHRIPIGISIAKTNCEACVADEVGIQDYATSLRMSLDVGAYYTINVSCPNAFGGQPFHRPEALERLLTVLDSIETQKPIFLKLSPDLTFSEVDAILDVVKSHRIHGFVLTNLTKQYDLSSIDQKEIQQIDRGGVSGKPVRDLSNALISYVYTKANGAYTIIGCGGVFCAEDAYEKIKRGASLVQLVTGMIYEGPQLIGVINKKIAELLTQDGYQNVSEAIGARYRS